MPDQNTLKNWLTLSRTKNIGAVVVNPSVINTPDVETFKGVLVKTGGRLLTVEDHQLVGGMGAMLSHALSQAGVTLKLASLGVQGRFGQSAYTALQLYQKHGLDSQSIADKASSLV